MSLNEEIDRYYATAKAQAHACERAAPPQLGAEVESILAEAARIVDGQRRDDYGTPKENHARTAALWNAYLHDYTNQGRILTLGPRDVCMLNILQKISRDRHAPKRDTIVDIAGYARNAELCE